MGGKEVLCSQSTAPERRGDRHNLGEGKLDAQLGSHALDDDNPGSQAYHGHPITISQCTFQAHIARVRTEAEVRAISEAVSATTKHEAGFSDFVGPFAYRLACVGHGAQRSPRNLDDHNRGPEDDSSDSEEGYCDNGDVGSGEKLLHLLQKWDVRNRVLMVTRIDGGFMMAELMGVRRYKFVIDRAKKLLENTDLASLRRAVDTDIHSPTTAETNSNLAAHEQAIGGRHGGAGGGLGGPAESGWDRFVVPISARRRISGHTAHGNVLGAPRASGGALIPPPCNSFGEVGGGGGRGAKLWGKDATNAGCAPAGAAGSTRTRARRFLSLAHLRISAKTVPFPRGHVPSVLGAKSHGTKRGRINHFAVRTPPPPSISCGEDGNDDDDTDTGGGGGGGRRGRYIGDGVDPIGGPGAILPSADARGSRHALAASGWSLPHELDPTSTVTRTGSSSANNWSIRTASRVSTCDTINSPSRVAAIMLGVTGVHTALPPPHTDASDGSGSSTSGGEFSHLEAASSSSADVDTEDPSVVDSQRRTTPGTGGGAPGCRSAKNDDTSWVGDVFKHHPGGGGGGGDGGSGTAVLERAGCSPPAVWTASGHEILNFSGGVDGCVFPPTGGGASRGGVAEGNGGTTRPLLHRAPGSGVRDEPPPSLVVVRGDGDHRGGHNDGAAAVAPLSNGSTVGRWKSDDDDGCSTISSATGGGEGARAKDDSAETPSASGKSPVEPSPTGFALVDHRRRPDELEADGRGAFAAGTETGEDESPGGPRRKDCDTPATWGSDDLADLRGMVSGRSDPPPTRSKSALRGWSVDRAVPACSPLVTQKRGTQAEKER